MRTTLTKPGGLARRFLHRAVPALLCCLAAPALAQRAAAAEAPPTVAVRIIAFNDFHGHLEAGDNVIVLPHPADPTRNVTLQAGGAAHLATVIKQLRAEVPNSIVVSAGDLFGGSPLVSALFRDEPTIEVMNALGLDVNAVGNHEFDKGSAELKRMIHGGCATGVAPPFVSCASSATPHAGAKFAVVSANVTDSDDRPWLPPYVVRTIDGVRIGIIGAVTRATPRIVLPNGIIGLRFRAETAAINRYAAELKQQGVNALVVVVHEGGETDGGANSCEAPRGEIFEIVPRLDSAVGVVITGHTHRTYVCYVAGRSVTQAGSNGRWITVVDVAVDRVSGRLMPDSTRARNVPVISGANSDEAVNRQWRHLPADPAVAAIVEAYRERAAPLAARLIGRLAAPVLRTPGEGGDHKAGRLIADAQLHATRSNGAQIAFVNPGGIRADLSPRKAPDGHVTYADAFAIQPFGNALVTMTITGAQLIELLESQWSGADASRVRFLQPSRGFSYTWSASAKPGNRINRDSLRLNGQAVLPDDAVRITVNSYLAEGGDGFRTLRKGRGLVGGPLDVDALVAFIQFSSATAPLVPSEESRIERRE